MKVSLKALQTVDEVGIHFISHFKRQQLLLRGSRLRMEGQLDHELLIILFTIGCLDTDHDRVLIDSLVELEALAEVVLG